MTAEATAAPRGKRILVVSMTTWGERGNWLSGKSLGATLQALWPDAKVDVVAAEELIPLFAEVGKKIKAATVETNDPEERFAGYSRILRSLEPLFPPGYEDAPEQHPRAAAELQVLADRLRDNPPDLLIGTKGVICRALLAALHMAGHKRPVINYVTNHGHFQFAVHRVPGAALHLTRLPEGREYLIENCGWAPESIRVIGYLVAAQQLMQRGDLPNFDEAERPHISVIIVSNRGGDEYVTVLERLVPFGDSIDVTFIALMDERLCAAANEVLQKNGITRWRVAEQLTQTELFHLMVQARAKGVCCLVVKASPNSIFEAVYFGLPMFLFRTGLPMEEWGADLVVSEKLGWVADHVDELTPPLLDCLSDIRKLQPVLERERAFAAQYLDQKLTIQRLRDAVESVVAAPATTV